MRFNSDYDFYYFKFSVYKDITDDLTKTSLNSCEDKFIPDELYYKLADSTESYLREVEYYSNKKAFFNDLKSKKIFKIQDIKLLSSFISHLSIGYIKRQEIRDNVDKKPLINLSEMAIEMINVIFKDGEVENRFKGLFNGISNN